MNIVETMDINAGIEEFAAVSGAILLDVRTEDEYKEGHIPGSVNLPLQVFIKISEVVPDKDTPLYVYCRSGARSKKAATAFSKLGYSKVKDLGGIINYSGKTE